MRELTAFLEVPTREELRARIPDRKRFQPEPRLVKMPELRPLEGGYAEVLRRKGSWRRIHPMHVSTLDGLAQGAPMEALIERARPLCPPKHAAHCERFVRKFVWDMVKEGYVEVAFEAPPEIFDGRYERVEELGRGGMGIVHLCRDLQRDGDLVVVKHAWGFVKPIEKAEQNVRAEANALARLAHPRIPALVDAFERGGLLHLVRGYAPGGSLTGLDPKPWDAPMETRMGLLRGCAEALDHVHARGLLYLDVKPDNFLVSSLEQGPLLVDFGICKRHEDGEAVLRGAAGSPGYAAPEVVTQRRASLRSDVYSLGRMFAFLATGRRFKWKHKQADVVEALAHVDEDERSLLTRMCAEAPEERPASMREVLAALR